MGKAENNTILGGTITLVENAVEQGSKTLSSAGTGTVNLAKEVAAGKYFKTGAKYLGRVGIGFNVLAGTMAVADFVSSDKSYGDIGKLGVTTLSISLTYSGGFFTVAGVSMGVWDASGSADWFYHGLDVRQAMGQMKPGDNKFIGEYGSVKNSPFK